MPCTHERMSFFSRCCCCVVRVMRCPNDTDTELSLTVWCMHSFGSYMKLFSFYFWSRALTAYRRFWQWWVVHCSIGKNNKTKWGNGVQGVVVVVDVVVVVRDTKCAAFRPHRHFIQFVWNFVRRDFDSPPLKTLNRLSRKTEYIKSKMCLRARTHSSFRLTMAWFTHLHGCC